jgi:hypothetical protein
MEQTIQIRSCIHDRIHPCTKEEEDLLKKGTFARYIVSHMEIDCKEQKAPKMTEQIPLVQLITLQIIRKS